MSQHHHHHHHHTSPLTLGRIGVTILLLGLMHLIEPEGLARMIIYIGIYLLIGYDILHEALHGILHGNLFDEHFLMTIATIGAFALAMVEQSGDYDEAIAVMLLYQIGEYFQGYAEEKSRKQISSLIGTCSECADVPKHAASNQSHSEAFITRFAKVYTPIVCSLALALAILPPLANMLLGLTADWGTWVYRSLTFLVISCPCALVISIPMSFFAGIGCASRHGILIKDSKHLETLAHSAEDVVVAIGTHDASAIELADVVLREANPALMPLAKRIAKHSMLIVHENIVMAIGIKLVCLVLGAFGIANMWLAVFADTGVMILAVLNAIRALYIRTNQK